MKRDLPFVRCRKDLGGEAHSLEWCGASAGHNASTWLTYSPALTARRCAAGGEGKGASGAGGEGAFAAYSRRSRGQL